MYGFVTRHLDLCVAVFIYFSLYRIPHLARHQPIAQHGAHDMWQSLLALEPRHTHELDENAVAG